jgi:glutamine amidotransferase
MKIEIIDLKINNIASVVKALKLCTELKIEVVEKPSNDDRSILILPGLGKFESGMVALTQNSLNKYISEKVNCGSVIVGICLGMQLLGEKSEESPGVVGLSLIPGESRKFTKTIGERVPNIGWARVNQKIDNEKFPSLSQGKDFYFVHSYHFVPKNLDFIVGETGYGNSNFVSVIRKENIIGIQFHPEKSAQIGISLIDEIIKWSTSET